MRWCLEGSLHYSPSLLATCTALRPFGPHPPYHHFESRPAASCRTSSPSPRTTSTKGMPLLQVALQMASYSQDQLERSLSVTSGLRSAMSLGEVSVEGGDSILAPLHRMVRGGETGFISFVVVASTAHALQELLSLFAHVYPIFRSSCLGIHMVGGKQRRGCGWGHVGSTAVRTGQLSYSGRKCFLWGPWYPWGSSRVWVGFPDLGVYLETVHGPGWIHSDPT